MTAILPPIPRLVFTVLEPISLLAGAVAPFVSPEWFIAEQIAFSTAGPVTANARMVAYQLGNIYLLLAMVGIAVLSSTTEAKVVRNYLVALWLADISHVAITSYILGPELLLDIANWNPMTWGNIGATVLLFATRTAYLLGLFGPDRKPSPVSRSNKKLQ
ncbi:Uncharacterized protein BP5553_06665 [Venustampulla echinocandica]|uniref:DUF7704 domain-containing protein n=1 Tax=Venustampulla echinocandica TaxID=2656787 RepID=A0A370TKK0_9HELO|nr:Uncharacterized protein BP5553_06665 [Venustampulla echinocandica]RDL36053.1 Uncharacterized protein BP5553_06665 [Venustampulla echinocandica]